MKDEEIYKDRASQIQAIDKTFEQAKEEITKLYSKPGVTPIEVLPVFPDFELWKHPFAQVIFDSDPAPKGRPQPTQMEEMSEAILRGLVDENNEQFVAYFLPTEETLSKRKRDSEDGIDYNAEEEYDYTLAREYNWNVKNKLSRGYEETYFFVFREDGMYYNELEARVRLSKRRKAGGAQMAKSRLIVKHRELNEREIRAQKSKISESSDEEYCISGERGRGRGRGRRRVAQGGIKGVRGRGRGRGGHAQGPTRDVALGEINRRTDVLQEEIAKMELLELRQLCCAMAERHPSLVHDIMRPASQQGGYHPQPGGAVPD